MSGALAQDFGAFWPYLVIIVVGCLPTECWRLLGLFVASGLDEESEFLHWVRLVATALLVAVVAKLLLFPSGMLATIPLWGRLAATLAGLIALFAFRRSIIAAVIAGELVLVGASLV